MQKDSDSQPLCATDLSWSGLQKAQCDEGKAYCWMDCLDLPTTCSMAASECVNGEAKQCCTEDITQDCEDMDTSCHWECRTTTTSLYPHNDTTITTSSSPETTTSSSSSVICHPSSIICHPPSVICLTIYLFSAHLCSILSELDSEDLHLVFTAFK